MKLWVLDIYYHKVADGTEVHIWGRDENGKVDHITDSSLYPHFMSSVNMFEGPGNQPPEFRGIYNVQKKYNGEMRNLWKFHFTHPDDIPKYRGGEVGLGGDMEVFEADVMFTEVYSNAKHLSVSGWNENNGEYVWTPVLGDPPVLTVMPLDIECYNKPKAAGLLRAKADSKLDPINVAGLGVSPQPSDGSPERWALRMDTPGGERLLLERMRDQINFVDPDVIATFAGTRFDIQYIMDRCAVLGVPFKIGRDGSEPYTSQYGAWRINGRAHLDLSGWAKQVIPHIKPLGLKNIGKEYLHLSEDAVKDLGKGVQYKYWDGSVTGSVQRDRATLIEYNLSDVAITMQLSKEVLPFAITLSSLTGLPIGQLFENKGHRTAPHQIDHYLMRLATEENEVIPMKPRGKHHNPFQGAVVFDAKPGVHKDVYVVDFTSMYPHILMKLFPGTLMATACRRLMEERAKYRKVYTELGEPTGPNYALKILLNVVWGYYGWDGSRWGDPDRATAIARMGREIIVESAVMAEQEEFNVAYGDTDSIFLEENGNSIEPEEFAGMVSERFKMPARMETTYAKLMFCRPAKGDETIARKKAYMGLTPEGKLEVKGLETIKGDWCDVARKCQRNLGSIVLYSDDPWKGAQYVNYILRSMWAGKYPLHSFIIRKTAGQEEYKALVPQGVLAKKMGLPVGSLVEYVIVKGGGQLWEKAVPADDATFEDLDLDYYARSQIMPASMRILGTFGIRDDEIMQGESTVSLDA